MNLKSVAAVVCCLPITVFAESKLRIDKNSCHFPHDRDTDVETKLAPCEVTQNFTSATYIAYARGRASRLNMPVGAVPVSMDPPTSGCRRAPQWSTLDCDVYDDDGNVYQSRSDSVNVQVCVRDDGNFDIYYDLQCWGASRIGAAVAAEIEAARFDYLESQTVQDDALPVPASIE